MHTARRKTASLALAVTMGATIAVATPAQAATQEFTAEFDGASLTPVVTGTSGVTVSPLAKSTALEALTPGYTASGWAESPVIRFGGGGTSADASKTAGKYIEFTIAAPTDADLSALELSGDFGRGGTTAGERGIRFATDDDGFTATIGEAKPASGYQDGAFEAMLADIPAQADGRVVVRGFPYHPTTEARTNVDNLRVAGQVVTADPAVRPSAPTGLAISQTAERRVITDVADYPGFDAARGDRYNFYEPVDEATPTGRTSVSTRTSSVLEAGRTYNYAVSVTVNGVESERAVYPPITIGSGTVDPGEPGQGESTADTPDATLRSTWQQARRDAIAQGSYAPLTAWMDKYVSGARTPRSGTHRGGTVTSQAEADAMRGKTVTGRIDIPSSAGTVVFDQVTFDNKGKIEILGGNITFRRSLIDQGPNSDYAAPFQNKGGVVTFDRVEIINGTDSFQQYRGTARGQFVYTHDVRQTTAPFTDNRSHFDAYQIMGGNVDIYGAYSDYLGGPGSGQNFYVGHDVTDTGTIKLIDSVLIGANAGHPLTMQSRENRWPEVIEFDGLLASDYKGSRRFASIFSTSSGGNFSTSSVSKETVTFLCGNGRTESHPIRNGLDDGVVC